MPIKFSRSFLLNCNALFMSLTVSLKVVNSYTSVTVGLDNISGIILCSIMLNNMLTSFSQQCTGM